MFYKKSQILTHQIGQTIQKSILLRWVFLRQNTCFSPASHRLTLCVYDGFDLLFEVGKKKEPKRLIFPKRWGCVSPCPFKQKGTHPLGWCVQQQDTWFASTSASQAKSALDLFKTVPSTLSSKPCKCAFLQRFPSHRHCRRKCTLVDIFAE